MFDYVRCEVPLPDGFTGELQTKDFDEPYMDRYTISKDGRLMVRYVEREEPVPESEWEYKNPQGALHEIWHEQSKTRPIYAERDMNFHGTLNFYGCVGDRKDGTWEWFEYNAKFTDGKLVSIERDERRRD